MRPAISPVIWYREPRAALAWLEKAFGFETALVVDDGQGGWCIPRPASRAGW